VIQGPRQGPSLAAVVCAGERTAVARTELDRLMTARQEQPAVLQTDRGSCFVGAEGGNRTAVPGRLTLWLWGLGIQHQILPAAKPWRNGAVERFNGAIEHSWQGEADGLADLQLVWNWGKDVTQPVIPYVGRAGFSLAKVWQGLATVRVRRSVDRQGKLSLWDRPVRVGARWADREVVVAFDAAQQVVVVHDKHGQLIGEKALPWLTDEWLWAPDAADDRPAVTVGADQGTDSGGTATVQ
jgi:hypothetical protein